MKLASVSFKAVPRMPGLRPGDLITVDTDKPSEALKGWRLSLRGQQVFFVSPPGWVRDQSLQRNAKGPVTVFEVPRAEVYFQWSGTADEIDMILKGGKYDSEPFGWSPPKLDETKPLFEQIPASQMGD